MAVTKISSKQVSNIPTSNLLSQRDEAQRVIASEPKNSADYKAATANLNVLNKEIGKDLGVSSNVAKQLTAVQALSVQEARNTFSTDAKVGTVPASVQKAIDESLSKNIKAEEKKIITALENSQQSEDRALRDAGVSSTVLSAARAENKIETNELKTELKNPGFQGESDFVNSLLYTVTKADGTEGDSFIRTGNAAYANTDAGKNATKILDAGYGLLDEFSLPQAYSDGKTTVGFSAYQTGLAALDRNAETGEFSKGVNLSTPVETSGRSVSHALTTFNAINQDIKNPAAVSNKAEVVSPAYDKDGNVIGNIVQDTLLDYKKGDTVGFYLQKPDGTYEYRGGSKSFTPTGDDGFFSSVLGKVLVGVGAGVALGPLAGLLGGGTATLGSTIAAGSILGAGSSWLTGGDPLIGALTGGIGGGFASYIGDYGGIGSYLARNGVDLSVDAISLLNKVLPGLAGGPAPITDLSTSLLDDAAFASAQNAINTGAAAGLLDDATAATLNTGINNARGLALSPNQIEDLIPTPTGGGTMVRPNVTPGTTGGIGFNPNAGGSGFNINPEDVIPTPAGGGTLPPPDLNDLNLNAYIPPPAGAGTIPFVPSPNVEPTSFLDTVINVGSNFFDDAVNYVKENPLSTILIASSALDKTPVPTGVGNEKLPAWVTDPAMSAVIPRIQAAQAAMPAPMPNLFNAQFQRGGLGAGQFIGYDLLNRTGDIPQQTLLGVSPLAMPPMNLLGVNSGQAPTSAPALV